MDLKITWTCHLKDEKWGFSDLLNGRKLNEETKEEIKDLVEEDIYDAIYSDGAMEIEADTGESNCTIHGVVFSEAELKAKLEEQKEEHRQWLMDEGYEILAERL